MWRPGVASGCCRSASQHRVPVSRPSCPTQVFVRRMRAHTRNHRHIHTDTYTQTQIQTHTHTHTHTHAHHKLSTGTPKKNTGRHTERDAQKGRSQGHLQSISAVTQWKTWATRHDQQCMTKSSSGTCDCGLCQTQTCAFIRMIRFGNEVWQQLAVMPSPAADKVCKRSQQKKTQGASTPCQNND